MSSVGRAHTCMWFVLCGQMEKYIDGFDGLVPCH